MEDHGRFSHPLRIADLGTKSPTPFVIEPDQKTRAAIAADLGIPGLRKLRFAGHLAPLGKSDWQLTASLGATAVQDCVVTLRPVTTRIDEDVNRTYLANPPEVPEGDEIEMPQDDTVESLPDVLDLGAVMIEALALALPEYPHAEGVDPLDATYSAPGAAQLTDEDVKPFASLAALRDKLGKPDA